MIAIRCTRDRPIGGPSAPASQPTSRLRPPSPWEPLATAARPRPLMWPGPAAPEAAGPRSPRWRPARSGARTRRAPLGTLPAPPAWAEALQRRHQTTPPRPSPPPESSQAAAPRRCVREGDYADTHTHRRNRHGSWRDGKGGALDALTLSESEVEGGADVAAPSESSKATPNHRGAIHCCATVRIAGGRQHRRRQRRQRDTTPAPSLRLMTAHAPKPCTRRISHTPHRIARWH